MDKLNVQYGCGLFAPDNWINFDVSPTLRLQKSFLIGPLLRGKLNVVFPENVKYGNIIKGLPIQEGSCDNVYCSHTLEHFSFKDCQIALQNTYKILKPGGYFRCVVPDLEIYAKTYLINLNKDNHEAGNYFIRQLMMGLEERKRGLKNLIISNWGNSHHLWMWDHLSLKTELSNAGFSKLRRCKYNDSIEPDFKDVEDIGRFTEALAFECIK